MMICRNYLYDLGLRNTFQVLQEAGKSTLWSIEAKIFDDPDRNQSKLLKYVEDIPFPTFSIDRQRSKDPP